MTAEDALKSIRMLAEGILERIRQVDECNKAPAQKEPVNESFAEEVKLTLGA